jgi:RNA-directed DNA polymerase
LLFLGNNDNNGLNGNNNLNNNGRFVGIAQPNNWELLMYVQVCGFDNLKLAEEKARKHKTLKPYVVKFEAELTKNLAQLQQELLSQAYRPRPLETFILRDPKTRTISKSDFRDRIVHHALCNIIEPLFDKQFIYDNYANRRGKGTFNAIKRFEKFKRKVSHNNTRTCYVLKADVKHYFDTVDHDILLSIVKRQIHDERVVWLIKTILDNHYVEAPGKGMPLGNLTSQFFANVYLNELDQFVKHELRAKYYIRYVDDLVVLSNDKQTLASHQERINRFVLDQLALELHPDKTKILTLQNGVGFLGLRVFAQHKLLRKKNMRKFEHKLLVYKAQYVAGEIEREQVIATLQGWLAYATHADTYKYQRHIVRCFNQWFPETELPKPRENAFRWSPESGTAKPQQTMTRSAQLQPSSTTRQQQISSPPRTAQITRCFSASSRLANSTLHDPKDITALQARANRQAAC